MIPVILQAHSLHQTTAEAEWNAETKKLEVSLTVFVNDLELALMRQSEREMRVEKTAAAVFDEQARLYLVKNFVVTDAAGQKAKVEWLGRELDKETQKTGEPTMTLFFEIVLPGGLQGVSVLDAVFGDLFADEVNLLLVRRGAEKTQLLFKRGDAARKL
ncbi:MAG: DUF6702 family protein [Verrucomicrobiaceae bacterium]